MARATVNPPRMSSLQRLPRTQLLAGVAVIIVVAELFANFVDVGDDDSDGGSVGEWLGLSAFGIAVAALLLLVVVPRLRRAGNAAVVLGVLALVTVVVFWSALPFAFGAAAIAASAPGDEQPTAAASSLKAGAALGVLAIVAAFVFCVIG